MNKYGILLAIGLVVGCNTYAAVYHVGDVIEIPVGPARQDYDNCRYEVANTRDVYFALDRAGATNILAPVNWDINWSPNEKLIIHRVKAIKPGMTTITYNRVPDLGDCGCQAAADYLGTYRVADKYGEMVEMPVMDQSMIEACNDDCKAEVFKQTHKNYTSVTITVLPAE
jgi:hypothetical protein